MGYVYGIAVPRIPKKFHAPKRLFLLFNFQFSKTTRTTTLFRKKTNATANFNAGRTVKKANCFDWSVRIESISKTFKSL